MTQKRTKIKQTAGRPRREYDEGVIALLDSYKDGPGTVTDLCKMLGVRSEIFYRWMKEKTDFRDAVMRVRDRADDLVENGLFKRAIGFDYVETVNRTETGGKDGEKTVEGMTTKVVPPDPGAAMNWLKNRRPDKWREKKEITITGDHITLMEKYLSGEISDE